MEPRLKTSTKWSPFPMELSTQIKDVLMEGFSDFDLNGTFVVDGLICPGEIVLRIGLNKNNMLRQDNFEASLEYSGEEDKAIEIIHIMVDFLGHIWETFLEDEPELEDMPLGWVEHRFQKSQIFLRYTSVNTALEKQADEILNAFEKKLVHELPDDEGSESLGYESPADSELH